jgi:heme-degrading monooxygenase HmoA
MYIRLNMFSVGSGQRAEFERLADRFAPIFRAQKGFKRVTFFEADARGRGVWIVQPLGHQGGC